MRDAAHFDFDEKWFGQQAVYRVSMGNFVSAGFSSRASYGMHALGITTLIVVFCADVLHGHVNSPR